jgi:starvation-inducible DNA-binding protein
MKKSKKSKSPSSVVELLDLVLADSYSLMALTHSAHWNVEGPNFFSLHTAFEEQYQDLFAAVDELAERMRFLKAYAIGGMARFAKVSGLQEPSGPLAARDYVTSLLEAHEKTIKDFAVLRDAAGEAEDAETQDMAITRLQWHQKIVWMLKSWMK